jgi:hypothetical protein
MSGSGVRRAKAAFSQWVRDPPGYRSSRKHFKRQVLLHLGSSQNSGNDWFWPIVRDYLAIFPDYTSFHPGYILILIQRKGHSMGFRDKDCDQQIQQTILQLSEDIGTMADRIGEMADRILETQRIQSENLAMTQENMLKMMEMMGTQMNDMMGMIGNGMTDMADRMQESMNGMMGMMSDTMGMMMGEQTKTLERIADRLDCDK